MQIIFSFTIERFNVRGKRARSNACKYKQQEEDGAAPPLLDSSVKGEKKEEKQEKSYFINRMTLKQIQVI